MARIIWTRDTGLLLLSIWLFLYGCTPIAKDRATIALTHAKDYENNLFIGIGGYMVVTNDHYLIGMEHGGDAFFYRQDLNRPDSVCRFAGKGQGPDEFIHPFSLQYINDSTMGSYDILGKKFGEISLSTCSEPARVKTVKFDDNMNARVIKTAYNQYIGTGVYPDGMYIMFDSSGTKIKSFFEYPFENASEKSIKNQLRAMAYQGKIASNLSNTRFVYGANSADIIYFYDIENSNIRFIRKIENRFCEYVPEEQNGSFGSAIKTTNRHGFVDIYATDQHVYALYSGKTYNEYREQIFAGDRLRIYDWSGDLLAEAALDVPCKFLCVSPDDETMWAIAEIPEPTIIRFDLAPVRANLNPAN
jgi:hypothetical protein